MDNLSKTQLTVGGAGYGLAVLLAIFFGSGFPISWPILLSLVTTMLLLIVLIAEVFKNAGYKLLRKQKDLPDKTESTLSASFITTILIVVAWSILFLLNR